MTTPSIALIESLRDAARNLEKSPDYQWGHMGNCNCGFLARSVTRLSGKEIHTRAMVGHGDWTEQLRDYCPSSGLPLDEVIDSLTAAGFDIDDLAHLERLSLATVRSMPGMTNLQHNRREDAVLYMRTWANLLEDQLLQRVSIPSLTISEHEAQSNVDQGVLV